MLVPRFNGLRKPSNYLINYQISPREYAELRLLGDCGFSGNHIFVAYTPYQNLIIFFLQVTMGAEIAEKQEQEIIEFPWIVFDSVNKQVSIKIDGTYSYHQGRLDLMN